MFLLDARPPPPPPPPGLQLGPVPRPVEDFLRARTDLSVPWQVRITDVRSGKRRELSPADAQAFIDLLGRADSWMNAAYGCVDQGANIRVTRGNRPPLHLWTSCGNVRLDSEIAT